MDPRKPKSRAWSFPRLGALSALVLSLLAGASAAQDKSFPLTKAVPHDVFIVTGERYNPERQFLMDYWAEVGTTFLESGVLDDLHELIFTTALGLGEEQMGEIERVRERFSGLCSAVDWKGLSAKELVFAERLPEPIVIGGGPGFIAQPELVLMSRLDPEGAQKSFADIKAIFEATVEEINKLGGLQLAFEAVEREGATLTSFDFLQMVPDSPQMPICLGYSGDVLFLTMGNDIRDEVTAFLTGTSRARPIADTPRYKAAMSALPAPEDGFEYFDMPNLRVGLDKIVSHIFGMIEKQIDAEQAEHGEHAEAGEHSQEAGGREEPAREMSVEERAESVEAQSSTADKIASVRKILESLMHGMDVIESSATVRHTDGHSAYGDTIVLLSDGYERNPIYPVLAGSKSVDDFARYLPKEAKSYSVSGGFDFVGLYNYVLRTIGESGALGDQVLAKWRDVQQQLGFNFRKDVIGWIDGASVSVTFEHEGQEVWVGMMKVKSREAALEKLALAVDALPKFFQQLQEQAQNPMLGMFAPRIQPCSVEGLDGFHEVAFGMMPQPAVCGVLDDYLIMGTSAKAVLLTQATAAGEHPNVRANEAMMKDALVPEGAAVAVKFTDHSKDAENIAGILGGVTMAGNMAAATIPEPEIQQIVLKLCGMLGKLTPVVASIDFFESSASYTTFQEKAWHVRTVTHYVAPDAGMPSSQD